MAFHYGRGPYFLVKSVLRFRAGSGFGVQRVAKAAFEVQHGSVPDRLPKTRARRAPRLRARAAEGNMAIDAQDTEFRHPDTAAYLRAAVFAFLQRKRQGFA